MLRACYTRFPFFLQQKRSFRLLHPHAILYSHRDNMRSNRHIAVLGPISSHKRWTLAFARAIAPLKYLRVLPTLTRPSLFGSD